MHAKTTFYSVVLTAGLIAIPALAEEAAGDGEENRRWTRVSQRLDADGDGQVTKEEFQSGDHRFERYDRNDDGVLTADDFAGLPSHRRGPRGAGLVAHADQNGDGAVTTEEWQAHVTALDANGDGVLSSDELPKRGRHGRHGSDAGKSAGAGALDIDQNGQLEVSEIGVVFEALDVNGDGTVSAEEMPRRGPRGRRGGPALRLLRKADADQDRQLTSGEWSAFTGGLDTNGDAVLTGDELAALRPADAPAPRGDHELSVEIARLDELFARLDANTDGVISEDEWPRRGHRGRGRGVGAGR